jgi:hypothetical protein
MASSALSPFAPNDETTERGAVFGPSGLEELFAFSLHVEAARRWFGRQGVRDDHAYTEL